jgi:hypothetical protein
MRCIHQKQIGQQAALNTVNQKMIAFMDRRKRGGWSGGGAWSTWLRPYGDAQPCGDAN